MTTSTAVKERPILFSTPMVKAILEGKKTQTRRVVKHGLLESTMANPKIKATLTDNCQMLHFKVMDGQLRESFCGIKCPYGQIGDRLWVRESWQYSDDLEHPYWYRQKEMEELIPEFFERMKWKPSIHMAREASRILLEITDIRVERLQMISEEDAKAEGADRGILRNGPNTIKGEFHLELNHHSNYKPGFEFIWKSINGAESWNSNPWVWVVEFKRVDQ